MLGFLRNLLFGTPPAEIDRSPEGVLAWRRERARRGARRWLGWARRLLEGGYGGGEFAIRMAWCDGCDDGLYDGKLDDLALTEVVDVFGAAFGPDGWDVRSEWRMVGYARTAFLVFSPRQVSDTASRPR